MDMMEVEKTEKPHFDVVPVSAIIEPTYPLRTTPEEGLDELVQSIKASDGILEPILVRPIHDGRYEVVAGHRRLLAAKKAGLAEIPVIIKGSNDVEAFMVALTENVQRKQMSDFEVARALKLLVDKGLTPYEIARKMGKSPRWVHYHLRMFELQKFFHEPGFMEKLTEKHARVILSASEEARKQLIT